MNIKVENIGKLIAISYPNLNLDPERFQFNSRTFTNTILVSTNTLEQDDTGAMKETERDFLIHWRKSMTLIPCNPKIGTRFQITTY